MGELVIALGKPPSSKSKGDKPKDKEDGGDAYDALSKGMMRAFKQGDEKMLATLLRECDFLGHGDGDDEGY